MSSLKHEQPRDQRLLWEPWITWQQLPHDVRQQAIDVLTSLYLETVKEHHLEQETNDDSSDH